MFASNTYLAIDNGSSGSVAIVADGFEPVFFKTPVRNTLDYTKAKKNINRVDVPVYIARLREILGDRLPQTKAFVERPMVNPTRFAASGSALRCLEATLIILEQLQIPYQFVDSKEWQSEMLPSGVVGSDELKKASLDIGLRKFPRLMDSIKKHKDADSLLMAEWARVEKL